MATMKGMPQHTPPPPWTPSRVAELNTEQQRAGTDALHCGTDRHEHVPLTATLTGWRCPLGCDYNPRTAPANMDVNAEPGPNDGRLTLTAAGRLTPMPPQGPGDQHCGEECSEGHTQAGRCTQAAHDGTDAPLAQELEEARREANAWERKFFEMVEKYTPLAERLNLAHKARRGKEAQLDEVRRALCDTGLMRDDDPYSHADLADVIRRAHADRPEPAARPAPGPVTEDTDPGPADGRLLPEGILAGGPLVLEGPAPGVISAAAPIPGHGRYEPGCPWCDDQCPDGHTPTLVLTELATLHQRGPGLHTTPLGPVQADDVCVHCQTAWPCDTGRILTRHTTGGQP